MKEIRNIIHRYKQADRATEKLALATVVRIEESSYRRIGARMLVSSNGTWVGGISGGCLEGDALRRSQMAIFKGTASIVSYDTLDEEERNIGIGLGCNGRIDVLFVPIDFSDPNNPLEVLANVAARNEACVLLNLISCPTKDQVLGMPKLVYLQDEAVQYLDIPADDLMNKIEETRIKRRPQIMDFIHPKLGDIQVLAEYIRPEYRLVIVGDNYDVLALLGLVEQMGWQVYVVGRKKKMSKAILHQALQCFEYEQLDKVPIDEFTAVILMTHDFEWDTKLVPQILTKKPPYLGMLGPKKRKEKLAKETGIQLDKVPFFYSPVGLDIGAETPEEIGLSIISEIISVFRHRDGSSLKFRKHTIHEREID